MSKTTLSSKLASYLSTPLLSLATLTLIFSPATALAAPSTITPTVSGDPSQPTLSWDEPTTEPNGAEWTEAAGTLAPKWSARSGHTTAVFDNKLWVMGGNDGSPHNDVWYSEDGVTWTEATSSAEWSARSNHTSAVFDNKLWVMGGATSGTNLGRLNDVWSSSDGISWTLETDDADWIARNDHTTTVFDNKLWVTGGQPAVSDCDGNGDGWYCHDIWSSSDGVNWALETAAPGWIARSGHTTAVFDDKLWILGGRTNVWGCAGGGPSGTPNCHDAWSSQDGINWTLETANTGWAARSGHTTAVFDNKLWVIGGNTGGNHQVWSSLDGVSWTLEVEMAGWDSRRVHTAPVFSDKLWLIGGWGGGEGCALPGSSRCNIIWSSSDGVNWAHEQGWWPFRSATAALAFDDQLWILGGNTTTSGGSRTNTVWSSPDGVSWTLVNPDAEWDSRHGHEAVVFNNKLWVIAGSSSGQLEDVWSSPDGISWTLETDDPGWSARMGHEAVVFDDKLWVLGGTAPKRNDVWYSEDGVNWTEATDSAPWAARHGHEAVAFDGKLWVMGGNDQYWDMLSDVWYSEDGVNWTEATDSAPWGARNSHQAQVFDNKIWVMGGANADWDTAHTDVWYTEDGFNWIEATPDAGWEPRRGFTSAVFQERLFIMGGISENWNSPTFDMYSTPNNSLSHYLVCWDREAGECGNSVLVDRSGTLISQATPASNSLLSKLTKALKSAFTPAVYAQSSSVSFTFTESLDSGTWYFSVLAVTYGGDASPPGDTLAHEAPEPESDSDSDSSTLPGLPDAGLSSTLSTLFLAGLGAIALFACRLGLKGRD